MNNLLLKIAVFIGMVAIPASLLAAVGGGWSGGGVRGEYFSNPNFSGQPDFIRREVRINFNWSEGHPVGGSTSEPYASFPNQDFSVRWTGKVIPRFSETYKLIVDASLGVVVRWREGESDKWETLVETKVSPSVSSRSLGQLMAGKTYEIEISYYQPAKVGHCRVRWSSPSTTEEVIDPVAEQGLMFGYNFFADMIKCSKIKGLDQEVELELDDCGFAKNDMTLSMKGDAINGTYLLRIGGLAEISITQVKSEFIVDDQGYEDMLPKGVGYDEKSNVTTALVRIIDESGVINMTLSQSMRDATAKQINGVSFVQFMRPIEPGSETPHRTDELFYRPGKQFYNKAFTANRYCSRSICYNSGKWADRKKPTYRNPKSEGWGLGRSDCFEYLIMFANETGSDFLMSMSSTADNEYFLKLAQLIRYGSDGNEPYQHPQANPIFPPLNSNLRVYLEHGNEIWNWASPVTKSMISKMNKEVQDKTEDGQIVTYQGKANYRAWHALRTVRASEIFRKVFGDENMGSTVRFILEYQYVDSNQTASLSLGFINNWFNNGDGQHVVHPFPVNHYIWGAGGGAYYGRGNPLGEIGKPLISDGSFEETVIPDGVEAVPEKSKWKFSGGARLLRHLTSAVTDFSVEKNITPPLGYSYGWSFTVGDDPIYVYQLGRNYIRNSEGCRFMIFDPKNKSVVMEQKIGKLIGSPKPPKGYRYANRDLSPVRLEPQTCYYILAAEEERSPVCRGYIDKTAGLDFTINGSVEVEDTKGSPTSWSMVVSNSPEQPIMMGPVNFLYSKNPKVEKQKPLAQYFPLQPVSGQQAAIIRGSGEMAVEFSVPKEGHYALSFDAYAEHQTFSIEVNGQPANSRSIGDVHADAPSCAIDAYGRTNILNERYGSGVFYATAGKQQLVVKGKGDHPTGFVIIDEIYLASTDAIMESGFGSGEASGQPIENLWKQAQYRDTEICLAYGLARVSYESGWSIGGDMYQRPIQNWCKYFDPRARGIQKEAHDVFMGSGGTLPFWGVYSYFATEDPMRATEYPIMRSIVDCGQQLPAEADNGILIPGILDRSNMALMWNGNYKKQMELNELGNYNVWIVIAPRSATYELLLNTTAGGRYDFDIDGRPLALSKESGSEGSYACKLSKGPHGVLIRNRSGKFTLDNIKVNNYE